METILLSALLIFVLIGAMAIGVLMGRPPIKGSCGGMSALAGQPDCPICGGDAAKCEEASSPRTGPPGTREDPGEGEGKVRRFDPRNDRT